MARETKAQRDARYEAEREAYLAKQVAEYPQRLMHVLARATNAYFELAVVDNKFVVKTRDRYDNNLLTMAYAHSPNSQEQMETLEWALDRYEQEQAEQRRLAAVKAEALRKVNEYLTDEEREMLDL